MEENSRTNIVNHYEAGSNCQVFNGNITGCVFAMPGSTVTQQAAAVPVPSDDVKADIPEVLVESELWQRLIDADFSRMLNSSDSEEFRKLIWTDDKLWKFLFGFDRED